MRAGPHLLSSEPSERRGSGESPAPALAGNLCPPLASCGLFAHSPLHTFTECLLAPTGLQTLGYIGEQAGRTLPPSRFPSVGGDGAEARLSGDKGARRAGSLPKPPCSEALPAAARPCAAWRSYGTGPAKGWAQGRQTQALCGYLGRRAVGLTGRGDGPSAGGGRGGRRRGER